MFGKILQQVAGSQIGQTVGRMASKPMVQALGRNATKVGGGVVDYGKEMVGGILNPQSLGMTAVGMAPMFIMQAQAQAQYDQQQQQQAQAQQIPQQIPDASMGSVYSTAPQGGPPPDAMAQQMLRQQTAPIQQAPPPGYASGIPAQSQQSGGDMGAIQDMTVAAGNPASAGLPQVDPETISYERKRIKRQLELNSFYDSALNQLRNKQRAEEP
jgi:hypothetical protein